MNKENNNLTYQILLTLLPKVGNIMAKNLLSYCGSLEGIFNSKLKSLLRVPGIGRKTAQTIIEYKKLLPNVAAEIEFIKKNKIQTIFFLDKKYPQQLRHCSDSPILLYYKGNADLNQQKIISVVGTRNATDYGRDLCDAIVSKLMKYNPLIISGLAYGVDGFTHKACVRNGVATVGVFGHGLDRIYPAQHTKLAHKMLENGGWLTEFRSETLPDRENFPRRNRIIAGMSEATIVVETAEKGGSIITAQLANTYNREVYAFPGLVQSIYSKGCHQLIKTNCAALIDDPMDIAENLGWTEEEPSQPSVQPSLFIELSEQETQIIEQLRKSPTKTLHIDALCYRTHLTHGRIAGFLLELELKGLLKVLPGSRYKLA